MAIYIIIGIMLILSILVVVFALKSDDKTVRTLLSFITIIPWIILAMFLFSYTK